MTSVFLYGIIIVAVIAPHILLLAAFAAKRRFKMVVTKKSVIGDILDEAPDTAQFFFEIGMHCLGCPASRGESIEDACAVHGTDADALVDKINKFLENK